MRIWALVKRIMQQMIRDKRTLALLFIAPLLILTLMYFIFNGEAADPKLVVEGIESDFEEKLKDVDIDVIHDEEKVSSSEWDEDIDGIMEKKDDSYILTLKNDDPSVANGLKVRISQAASSYMQQMLVEGQKDLLTNQKQLVEQLQAVLKLLPSEAQEGLDVLDMDSFDASDIEEAKDALDAQKDTDVLDVRYVYGDEETEYFDVLSPLLVGFFVFFFVFLISGIGLLKERTSGTLERLMSTPIQRFEIVFAYLIGFGIFAIIQTVIVVLYSIQVLDMVIIGSVWLVIVINLLLALVALSLGILLSTFAATEFQMVQFIPVVIVPQVFFSGIFPLDQMADWLQGISYVMPIYYGADALQGVMYKGYTFGDIKYDMMALSIFAIVFIVLNIFALRRYRTL